MSEQQKDPYAIKGLITIAVIILICYFIFSPSKDQSKPTKYRDTTAYLADKPVEEIAKEPTLGQKLAFLEYKEDINSTTAYSLKLDEMVEKVALKYQEPQDTVADWTQRVCELSKKEGKPLTCKFLLEEAYKFPQIKGMKYRDVMELYGMGVEMGK